MPGACELAEWNVPHAPHEHRSLLIEIDEDGEEGLAEQQIFTRWDRPAATSIVLAQGLGIRQMRSARGVDIAEASNSIVHNSTCPRRRMAATSLTPGVIFITAATGRGKVSRHPGSGGVT